MYECLSIHFVILSLAVSSFVCLFEHLGRIVQWKWPGTFSVSVIFSVSQVQPYTEAPTCATSNGQGDEHAGQKDQGMRPGQAVGRARRTAWMRESSPPW